MKQHFGLSVNGQTIDAVVSVPFGNVVQVELYDSSKHVIKSGYKSFFLGISLNPFEHLKRLGATNVIDVVELITGFKCKILSAGTIEYNESDIHLQRRWTEFLSNKNIDRISNIGRIPVQLSLF